MDQTDRMLGAADADELHAFVDGRLDTRRHRDVAARIAADPEAAERARGYLRQRAAFAAMREGLVGRRKPAPLRELEDALCRALRDDRARAGRQGPASAA